MPTTPRPLPRIPPPYLTFVQREDVRSYRPLPTPPLQWVDSSSTHTSSSSFSSFSSVSSELPKSRPRLRITVTSPTFSEGSSLDSPTVQSPALCDPGQALSPVVEHRLSWAERVGQMPSANSAVSPMVFTARADIRESEEDEFVPAPRIPQLECDCYCDDRAEALNSHAICPTDLPDDHESYAGSTKSWKTFSSIVKVSMKSRLFRPKTRSSEHSGAPVTDAERVSRMPSPLDRAWYKEQGGWRWVERDISGVLHELRKLQ